MNNLETLQKPATQMVASETSSTAAAAHAKAMVEARYVMALNRPRNWDQVRTDVLAECKRPAFANNKSAWYVKPIGQGVEGLGIRFVEVALRCMTNIYPDQSMIFEDEQKEIHRLMITDLESNLTYSMDVKVSKTVERSKPESDGSFISVRKNNYGKNVYTVPANDDDLLNKRQALISKALRTLGMRLIPGDIQDEAETIIKKVRLDDAAKDPSAERKKIVDAFAGIGVKPKDLTAYLGHDLDGCSPAEIVTLRGIYGAIKEGEATWKTVMENKDEHEGKAKPDTKSTNLADVAGGKNETVNQQTGEITKTKPEPEAAKAAPVAQSDDLPLDDWAAYADQLIDELKMSGSEEDIQEIMERAAKIMDKEQAKRVLGEMNRARGRLAK
jgi:hypothetical protein